MRWRHPQTLWRRDKPSVELAWGRLEEARTRGEDLEDQISLHILKATKHSVHRMKQLARRIGSTQSLEADRVFRDHIAESDGNRAVLEHQFSKLHAALSEPDICKADLVGT